MEANGYSIYLEIYLPIDHSVCDIVVAVAENRIRRILTSDRSHSERMFGESGPRAIRDIVMGPSTLNSKLIWTLVQGGKV